MQSFEELATDGKVVIHRYFLYLHRAIGLAKILLGEIEMGSQLRVGNFVLGTECWRLLVIIFVQRGFAIDECLEDIERVRGLEEVFPCGL